MAGQRGGQSLPLLWSLLLLLLLSFTCLAVLHLALEITPMGVTATLSPALPTSSTPMETSTLLPTTNSTSTATLLSSSPETEASTSEESSTFTETGNTSPPTEPPLATTTEDSVESSSALADTTASPVISSSDPMSTPSSSYPDRTTPNIFPSTMESTSGTEPSSPATSSAQASEAATLSTPTDLPTLTPVCPSGSSNTRLGAVAAVPVTTDGSLAVGTAFPLTTEDEWPQTTLTIEMSPTAADAETFPPWTEMDPLTVTSEYGSSVPNLVNGTKAPNTTESTEGNSAAPNAATTDAGITAQHPAVTPEAVQDDLEVPPDVPLGTTPVLEDVKEDILANRGEDTELSTGTTSFHTTSPLAVTWLAEPTAGVTVLPSQGLTTAKGAVEEGVILPEAIQSEASANSSSPSPDAKELLPTQQDGAVGEVEGINPEPAGEMAPAGEESPLAAGSGDTGDAINGEFSTVSSSPLPPEIPVMSGTVENPGNSSLLPGQELNPDVSLKPSNSGDGDGQGVPGVSSEASGSALSPEASRAPVAPEETEDTATSLLAPEVPTEAQSDTNLPVSATALPAEDVGAVDLASPSLQPALWQTPTGEQPLLLPDALTSSTDTPSAPGAAYPAPEAGTSILPEADGAAETPARPDLTTGPEAAVSQYPGESQPVEMPAGAPQEADGLGTGLNSDSDAPSPAPFVPDGLARPTAGIQGQGAEGVGDTAQAGGPGDASPYEDTQSDLSPSALQPSVSPNGDNGELLTGGTEDLANAELSPPSTLGDETEARGAPALGQVSSSSPAPLSNAGIKPDLSGAEGPGALPSESASAPGAVSPPLGSVAGPVSEAETPVSPDLSGVQGAPGSPSFDGSQPWGTAAGAPVGAGLPGAQGPDTTSTSAWDTPSHSAHEPVGPPSPGLGDQLGTNVGLPAAEGQGASRAEPALEGAGSGTESEPSLSSTAGNGIAAGTDQLPSAGSPSDIASASDVAAPSVSRGDEAGPILSAAPGPDSLSPASPESETGPGFGLVQGAESAGDVAQAENPESENANTETSPSVVSPQQDLTNTGELPAEETGDMAHAELSPPSTLGDGTGTGGAPALGQVSSPSPAPLSNAGIKPGLSGAEGPGALPSESASAPGAVSPPLGSVAGPVSEAETPVSPDLSGVQGAPGSPSFDGSQPWGTAAGAPVGAGLPGAQGPDTASTSAWDMPSSAAHEPVGPPSPGLGDQLGTNVGLPAAEGQGASRAEPALEGAGSGTESEPSLSSTAGNGIAAGTDQLPSAGSPSDIASASDVAAPSVSRGDEAGPILSAAPGPDSLSPASPESETGPGFGLVQGAESAGDVAQAENPESENANTETSPSVVSPQQDLTNTGELPAEETGDMAHAELSPPSTLGDETEARGAPALGQVSSSSPAPLSNAGIKPDLSGAEGPGALPSESASAPGAVSPPLGSVAGPVSEAETPVSPDLSGVQGAPGSPSFDGSQPWGTAAGAPVGAGLPGAQGPDTASTSAWDMPSSAAHEPVGPPSPGLGDQLGTNVGLPAAEGQGASRAEPALEGAGSGTESEPSLSSTAGNGIAAGTDQLPSAGSPSDIASASDVAAPSVSRGDEAGPILSAAPGPDSLSPASPESETGPGFGLVQGAESAGDVAQAGNPESENANMETSPSAVSPQQGELPGAGSSSGSASPSGDVAASSVSDPSSLGALKGADSAAEGLQPSLGVGTGALPAVAEGASEGAGDGVSTGQSQAPTGNGPAGSETLDGETGGVLQSASSSLSAEGPSLPVRTGEAADQTSLPGAAAAGGGLNTGLEAAGPQEASVSAPGTQSSANTELSDGELNKVSVEVPGGDSVNGGPSPGASLVPVAPDNSDVSNGRTTSVAASLLLPGHGLSSGLAPNGDLDSAPSTQSGSSPLLPGSPGGLPEAAGGAQSWSVEDEVVSGLPAPLGEVSPQAPISPNAAPVLPSAPQRGNPAEGVSASPGLSALPAVPLYGYGARENDQEYVERREDFNSPLFKPETGFPFGKTLRSSLYFTDNGQIIFPASDNSVLTYPNPPPNGFNGREEVPMIAVFWDNADFSRGVGTTFYQEFSTLNTAKPPFVRDVEAKIRRYVKSSYSAAWTLKITWEKAPVYAAWTDTRKTITYQAVLTTDGFRSYILMLYQNGGMQWDYTRLTSTNVLIGYTSGDGFYYNDDLTKRPPAAKYRPDQFQGYNTDLRGLWIYKLESRVGNNYWLKCLAWTGQQQEPRAWSQGLPSCPCSLQEGQRDPRFKSSRGGRWGARVSMLHSASPNQHGAGVRCLYDGQSQLIEGRQERYWRPSRQASPYRDQELKLYDWCCNRAGSPHLCARYSEKRPKIGCDGYQSPSTDSSEEAEDDSDEQIDGEDK
ncbi:hypothetical protein HGM15179_009065 [Zosterops borbonicus]|uniref:Uncharacterized protein n=2 Tax=Zosterops TaxID=36298 RepID=A0A8K1LLD0_9PASS|nr:hypothetical protein HGM15179_009065 [Zosterops borbonicus]